MRSAPRSSLALAGLCAVAAAATATAQAPPTETVELDPNTTRTATRLEVDADPRSTVGDDEVPQGVTIALARGLRIDTRARRVVCTDAQAEANDCPEDSKIGRGHTEVEVTDYLAPDDSFDSIARLDLFIADPSRPGDIAGIVIQATELVSGATDTLRGRVAPVPAGPYGAELIFDELPAAGTTADQVPGAFKAELKRLRLFVKARRKFKRTVVRKRRVKTRRGTKIRRRKVTKRITRNLLRTPEQCDGSWPFELRVRFATRQQRESASASCTSG